MCTYDHAPAEGVAAAAFSLGKYAVQVIGGCVGVISRTEHSRERDERTDRANKNGTGIRRNC